MRPIASAFSFGDFAEHTDNAVTRLLVEAADRGKEDMQFTTVHFDTVAPNFTVEWIAPGVIEVGPEDTFGGQVWAWLDLGTVVRYATMTKNPPFAAKTRPGSLWTSSIKSGGLAFVNTSMPRPGIEARGWTTKISLDQGKWFQDQIDEAIRKAQRASFRARQREREFSPKFDLPPRR